jgi:outer membrane autotransporter protein
VVPVETVLPPSSSANQFAIGRAIDASVRGGGILPLGFQNLLFFLSPAEMAAAFTQLSGEAGTGVAPAGIQAMNSFLSLVLNPFDDDRTAPAPLVVKALGYAPEGSRPPKAASAFASFYKPPVGVVPDWRCWSVWAAPFGGYNKTTGDPVVVGSHDRTARTFGVAVGLDYRLTPDTKVGFALAGGTTNFGLSDNLGGGRSDMFQAALYSRTYFNTAYVAAALAYAWHRVSTERDLAIVGGDHLTAEFTANNIAGRIEGGNRFAVPDILGLPGFVGVTPYGALQMQAFYTPAYNETSGTGSPFPLSYVSRTTKTTRTELGTWIDRNIPLDSGSTLALRARTAWAHDHGNDANLAAVFQSLPGSNFTVNGAEPVPNSLLFLAGAEIRWTNGFSVATWFDSEFAQRSETYTGKVRVRYAW